MHNGIRAANANAAPRAALQMFRAVRVVRVVKRIEPMRVIVVAFARAVPSILWMVALMLLVMYIYGILGVTLYRDKFGHFFGSLGAAMFTLFQIMTLDGWAGSCDPAHDDCNDGIARMVMYEMGRCAAAAVVVLFFALLLRHPPV
jgi:hypothetical protein